MDYNIVVGTVASVKNELLNGTFLFYCTFLLGNQKKQSRVNLCLAFLTAIPSNYQQVRGCFQSILLLLQHHLVHFEGQVILIMNHHQNNCYLTIR